MVYDTDYYTSRRPYSSSRPTISSYSVTPYYDNYYSDNIFAPSYSSYYNPIRVLPSYSRVESYINRPSYRLNYDSEYAEVPYHSIKRVIPIPMTRITTSPSRVYRASPVRVITPSARTYRRDIYSPVRVVTSPARIVSVRVRPSVLSREFDRIDRKYRSSPVGVNDTENYLNSVYSMNFNDETREIRASTRRLMREVHEPVPRAQSVSRIGRASSMQPTYSRFDPDLIDKYGNSLIENEFYVNKNILRPTRKTRDHIEILSNIKYREMPRRYTVKIGLDPARASRKFNEQKPLEDPAVARKELEELKAANRLERVKEVDEDLDKIKQKRLEERRLREEQALMEEKVKAQEQAKKEEADRQAELQRQERAAAQAAAERQAELERKAAEEARQADEARMANEARMAEEKRLAEEAESAKLAEAAKLEAEAAKKAEEEKKIAEAKAEAARKAEEARLAEEKRLAEEEAARKAEEEHQAELEKLKAEELKLAELAEKAKEEEEIELAKQANELASLANEMAKQEEELHKSESTDAVIEAEPEAPAAEPVEEAPVEAPVEAEITEESESTPVVEEAVAEPVETVAE